MSYEPDKEDHFIARVIRRIGGDLKVVDFQFLEESHCIRIAKSMAQYRSNEWSACLACRRSKHGGFVELEPVRVVWESDELPRYPEECQ